MFIDWLGGGFKNFIFTPTWGNDPIWLVHIFQMGCFNHQLVWCFCASLRSTNKIKEVFHLCSLLFLGLLEVPNENLHEKYHDCMSGTGIYLGTTPHPQPGCQWQMEV